MKMTPRLILLAAAALLEVYPSRYRYCCIAMKDVAGAYEEDYPVTYRLNADAHAEAYAKFKEMFYRPKYAIDGEEGAWFHEGTREERHQQRIAALRECAATFNEMPDCCIL